MHKKNKVFGIGLSRTGTTSLGAALQLLGYRHFGSSKQLLIDYVLNRNVQPLFDCAARFDCFEDAPWFLAYRELDKEFPDSKFVLTVRRDSQVWLNSYKRHCVNRERRFNDTGESRAIAFGYPTAIGYESEHIALYERHIEEVWDYFKGRACLLTCCWEKGDGWKKLCDFLNIPIPKISFPHKHKSKTLPSRISEGLARTLNRAKFPRS